MREVSLIDVCDVIAGQSPPSSTYNKNGEGIPFFQGKADFGELYPTVRYWCSVPKKLAKPNDILFSLRAPVGPTNISDIEACIGRGLAAIRCNEIDLKYLLHYFRGNENKIAALGTGSTFKAITIGTLKNLKIPLPPLPIQKKIADILDAADDYRQKTKALIDKYDELAQSLFLDMFGDPVRNEKGWKQSKLKHLCTKIGSGATPKGGKEAYVESGVSLIRSLNIHDHFFKYKNLAFINEQQSYKLKNVIVQREDVLLNITGASVCRCSIVPPDVIPARVNQHVAIIRCAKDVLNPVYLSHYLTSKNIKLKLLSIASRGGATREALTKDDLVDFVILHPEINLQKEFSKRMKTIEKQKLQAQESLINSEDLFQSLLQKAFKGELVK